jgi:integrase
LDGWLSAERKPVVVERVTRKVAGEYVSSRKQAGGDSSTINKDISALSTYWRWLEGKGHVSDNVWSRQSLPKKKVPRGQGKRPFRADEVKAFMAAEASALLKDAMLVAALTGMRVEEIARLKVEDTKNGVFHVREAKTAAGEDRVVPIHSALQAIVAQRIEGKKPDEYLFHECPTPKPGSAIERSQKISKQFTMFRRRLGLDDRIEGARQARADFHSFRRWFVRKAIDALNEGAMGYSPWTIAQVVGHEDGVPLEMTMVRYAGDESIKALRACVEAVRLP